MPGRSVSPGRADAKIRSARASKHWADANKADAKMSGRSNNSNNWCNSSAFASESALDLCVTP